MSAAFDIRAMRAEEVPLAVEWAAQEGWNPGLSDAGAFLAADPGGFLCAMRDGKMLACITAVRTGADFGFIGFYIARPDLRGQGIGFALWQAAMRRLEGRCIGLDGVIAQQANYRRVGFTLAWNNARYQSSAPMRPLGGNVAVTDAAALDFAALTGFDAECFGTPRPDFLRGWITTPGHRARAVTDGRGIAGYAVLRPCREGSKLGPVFARDVGVARALIADLVQHRAPGPLILDLPEPHAEAVELALGMGMEKVFETARMYTREPPPMARDRIFGLSSFELG